MHEYMTRHMVALTSMVYAQQELAPGDPFRATPIDGDYLARNRRAKDAQAAAVHAALVADTAPAEVSAPEPAVAPAAPPAPASETAAPAAHGAEPESDAAHPRPDETAAAPAPAPAAADAAPDPLPRRRGRPTNASRLAQQGAGGETADPSRT